MRKFLAVTIVLLMVAAMLSSVAFAENGKEHKGGLGAGKGQNQNQASMGKDNKGNSNGSDHANGKPDAEGTGIASDDNDDENEDADENIGDAQEDADDDADDDASKGEPAGQVKKNNNENKPDEKPQEGPNHGNAYGRVRNEQEVLDDIGLLAGEETAAQLNTLMTAYREAKDAETAKATLTALLDALTQACTASAVNGNGDAAEIQEQLALMTQFREKVMANAGNDNGTFLALMHAYENMFRVINGLEPVDEPEDGAETDPETVPEPVPGI